MVPPCRAMIWHPELPQTLPNTSPLSWETWGPHSQGLYCGPRTAKPAAHCHSQAARGRQCFRCGLDPGPFASTPAHDVQLCLGSRKRKGRSLGSQNTPGQNPDQRNGCYYLEIPRITIYRTQDHLRPYLNWGRPLPPGGTNGSGQDMNRFGSRWSGC